MISKISPDIVAHRAVGRRVDDDAGVIRRVDIAVLLPVEGVGLVEGRLPAPAGEVADQLLGGGDRERPAAEQLVHPPAHHAVELLRGVHPGNEPRLAHALGRTETWLFESDEQMIRAALASDAPTPISYATPKPDDVLAFVADKEINILAFLVDVMLEVEFL